MAMRPVPEMYPVTQRFRDNATIYNYGAHHGAIDYGVPMNTPLLAPEDGVVVFDGWAWDLPGGPYDWAARFFQIKPARGDTKTGGGIMTIIRNAAGSHWIIAHANRSLLNAGDVVREGQFIQETGTTGSSTGPHSHVALIAPNPDWGNGAFGGIDPEPYLTEKYAPLTYVSWQGAPTEGVGATTTEKDEIDMATIDELRRVIREEQDRHWNHKRPKLGGAGGQVSYGEQILWGAADAAKINAKLDALLHNMSPEMITTAVDKSLQGAGVDVDPAELADLIARRLLTNITQNGA